MNEPTDRPGQHDIEDGTFGPKTQAVIDEMTTEEIQVVHPDYPWTKSRAERTFMNEIYENHARVVRDYFQGRTRLDTTDAGGTAGAVDVQTVANSVTALQHEVKAVNSMNGWFDDERPFAADIALLHSEVSEAYEGFRNRDMDNVREELADVFIRLLDTCERHQVDLVGETLRKLDRNRQRGYKHGNKAQ